MQAASGLPTVDIIFAAQIINGLLLPFLTICLTLCLQDQISPGMRPLRCPMPTPQLVVDACLMFRP